MMKIICKNCSIEFNVYPSRFKYGNPQYCSKKCFHKHYRPSVETRIKLGNSIRGKMVQEKHPMWNGGKTRRYEPSTRQYYIFIRAKNHPYRTTLGYVYEHRYEMEKILGRFLKPEEVVHHRNKDTTDNRIVNLQLFSSQQAHTSFHLKERWARLKKLEHS